MARKALRGRFVPRSIFAYTCATLVVPVVALEACSGGSHGTKSLHDVLGVAAGGYSGQLGVAAGGYGNEFSVASGGYANQPGVAAGGYANDTGVAAGGYANAAGVAEGGFGGTGCPPACPTASGGFGGMTVAAGGFGGMTVAAGGFGGADSGATDGSVEGGDGATDAGEAGPDDGAPGDAMGACLDDAFRVAAAFMRSVPDERRSVTHARRSRRGSG